jgi:signal transduction histidine kinase
MPGFGALRQIVRRRTLRMRLALLYAALFCACAGAVGAAAVIFKPDFLVRSAFSPAPPPASHPASGCGYVPTAAHSCFAGTPAHGAGGGAWWGGLGAFLAGGTSAHNVTGGLAMLAIVAVVAGGVGWLLAGRVLRPLRGIIASARAISASNLSERLSLHGPDDEFRELGETLDDLFGRLEASFESQRHFVANASHELRTPLAAERTLLQVALADPEASAETLRSTCEQVLILGDQQERLIEALLTLASSERGIAQWEPFDLAEIAGKAILYHRREAERRGIRVEASLAAAPATGDPRLVESLIANLVDNATRHNADGGRVEISTAITGGLAIVSVGNTGSLIPPDEVDRLFQPFQRLGSERIRHAGGHGLGLAIVRAIAGVHGATLAARVRPEGGLDVEVTFPNAHPARPAALKAHPPVAVPYAIT